VPSEAEQLAWRIEEACFNAFPALRQAMLRGWLVRFADGLSRRANSANPMHAACADIDNVIDAIERLYEAQRRPTIFRVPSFVAAGIDARLAARGYAGEGETCVLHGAMSDVAAVADPAIELSAHAGSEWLAAMGSLQGHTAEQRTIYRRIVRAIAIPVAFAALRIDGRIAAVAYGAVHDGMLVFESVITDPRRRRQGLARRIVAALAAWGHDNGATGACLQVVADNVPARGLYDAFGLKSELYRYHYRRAPAPA
jgi:ribosomal protein S18 acetylase RimI-like enzyme